MRQEYVTTARAKGSASVCRLAPYSANALITVITSWDYNWAPFEWFGDHGDGSYPGIGDLLIQSISVRDYRLTQVLILFFGIIYFVVNLLVDFLYTLVDPRVKL
jgi:glutathione transport system permease protein